MHCGVGCGLGAVVYIHDCGLFERSAQRGETALHRAARDGNAEVVATLITAGADVHAQTTDGPAGLQAGLHALRG